MTTIAYRDVDERTRNLMDDIWASTGLSPSITGRLPGEQMVEVYDRLGNRTMPPKKEMRPDATETLKVADWIIRELRTAEKRAKGPDHVPVMDVGLKYKEAGIDPTAESAVEARRELVADIARYFGVPTRIVNAPTGGRKK